MCVLCEMLSSEAVGSRTGSEIKRAFFGIIAKYRRAHLKNKA